MRVSPGGGWHRRTERDETRVTPTEQKRGDSLLAGKLAAILSRPYAKGRDLYDLAWYLADRRWPPPNLRLLNSALRQTGPDLPPMTSETWRLAVARRVEELPWDSVVADVLPFLEDPQTVPTPEELLALLRSA